MGEEGRQVQRSEPGQCWGVWGMVWNLGYSK